ncbi:MAG: ABC transporter substrate-binding protein [Deinococcales bacterium]
MKKLSILIVVLMLAVGFAQTKVGINLELSGRFATIGNSTLQGVETALKASGSDIELSICDNATTVEGSVACANRFVDEGVVAVLGAISSKVTSILAAEVLQAAGIIMVSTSSTNPATTQG